MLKNNILSLKYVQLIIITNCTLEIIGNSRIKHKYICIMLRNRLVTCQCHVNNRACRVPNGETSYVSYNTLTRSRIPDVRAGYENK